MGGAKAAWEAELERGFTSIPDMYVCTNCFGDYALIEFIKDHQESFGCSYCDSGEDSGDSCELDLVLERILESIKYEWGDPACEGIAYESREGGWMWPITDTLDLLHQVGLSIESDNLREDIWTSLHTQEWVKKDPYSLSLDQTLAIGWEKFSQFVKNKARFVFFRAVNPDYDKSQHDEIDPVRILETIENIIKEIGLIEVLPPDADLFRVRIVDLDDSPYKASELGPPPYEFATLANRMSPSGIPMFYGAFDKTTAIKETYFATSSEKKAVIATFKPVRELQVIDLTKDIYVPSIFDEHARHMRSSIKFLIDFIQDFTKPIVRDDRSHIEYVPTQVVTEYIRHIFKSDGDLPIDGVIYPSSKNVGEKAIVIFADADQCVDNGASVESHHLLKLTSVDSEVLKGN